MRSEAARLCERGLQQCSVARLSVLVLVVLVVGLSLLSHGHGAGYPLTVDVIRMSDPQRLGVITNITVRVTNHGTTNIAPVFTTFSSLNSLYPLAWRRKSGPVPLVPGSVGLYDIESSAGMGIDVDDELVVRVGDARSHILAASQPVAGSVDIPPIVNSSFLWWVTDSGTGQLTPFGWHAVGITSPIGPHFGITRLTIEGRPALAFRFANGNAPVWQAVRVDQQIRSKRQTAALFDHGFAVSVYPTYNYTPGFAPLSEGQFGDALGIQITADARILWIVFADERTTWYMRPRDPVIVIQSPLNQWREHRIDLRALYQRLHWPIPQEADINLFATTRAVPTALPAFGPITLGTVGRSPTH